MICDFNQYFNTFQQAHVRMRVLMIRVNMEFVFIPRSRISVNVTMVMKEPIVVSVVIFIVYYVFSTCS